MSVVVVNVSSGSVTTTLPLISSVPGGIITIKDSGSASASNTITIVPTSGNTFEIGTYIINTPLGYITFLGFGTSWRVIATSYPNVPIYTSTISTVSGVIGPANATLNTLTVAAQTTLANTSNTGTLAVIGQTTLSNTSNTGTLGVAGQTTLANTSNTGTLGVAGNTTLAGTLTVNATSAPLNLSPAISYNGTSSAYSTNSTITVSAGPAGFNDNGSVYVNANDLLLKGQDLYWGGGNAAAASIRLQSGRSINGAQNSDNQIQFNTGGSQRGFFNNSGLTVNGTVGITSNISVGNFGNAGWNAGFRGEVRCTGDGNKGISIDPANNRIISYDWSAGTLQPLAITATSISLPSMSAPLLNITSGSWCIKDPNGANRIGFSNAAGASGNGYSQYNSPSGYGHQWYTNLGATMTLDPFGSLSAVRYEAGGGNMTARTGGVYNRGNDAYSSCYQSINWIPGNYASGVNWNVYDTVAQGAAGIICGAYLNTAVIEFWLTNTPSGSNPPIRMGYFNNGGLSVNGNINVTGNATLGKYSTFLCFNNGTGYDTVRHITGNSSGFLLSDYAILGDSWNISYNAFTSNSAWAIQNSGLATSRFLLRPGQFEWFYGGTNAAPTALAMTLNSAGLIVYGSITGNSKNFSIPHPIVSSCTLVHASIEGPRYDLIYRNRKQLVNGSAEVDIEKESTANGSVMTPGTFDALATNADVFLQNNETFDRVKGYVSSHMLFIQCENSNSSAFINWMVVAERHDKHLVNSGITDASGFLILEHYISTISSTSMPTPNLDEVSTLSTLSTL